MGQIKITFSIIFRSNTIIAKLIYNQVEYIAIHRKTRETAKINDERQKLTVK